MRQHILRWLFVAFAVIESSDYLLAQNGSISLSSATTSPGGTVVLGLTLGNSGNAPAGLQWTLTYPANQVSSVLVTEGPSATTAGKLVYCGAATSGQYTCLLTGLNVNVMAPGVVAYVQMTLTPGATTTSVALSNVVAGDASANAIVVSPAGPSTIAVPNVSTLVCAPGTLTSGGTANCSVGLDLAAPAAGTTVTPTSNNALLTVPLSVVVLGGTTTATFSATASANIASNQSAIVTATLGASSQAATINLLAPSGVSSLVCNPLGLGQTASSACTITLSQAALAAGSVVALASNNPLLTVPGLVTVAAGATTATFSATADPNIPTNQSAVVTATLGTSSQAATFSLLAQIGVSGVVCNPTSLGNSAASTCTVTLSQAAPAGGSVVTLTSNNALLTAPASVLVAAGTTAATFNATADPNIPGNQNAVVTATLGTSSQAITISLLAQIGVSGVVCNLTNLAQNATSICTITLTQSAPAGGSVVTLTSNNVLLTAPASVLVPAGAATAIFNATAGASIPNTQSAVVTAALSTSSQAVAIGLLSQIGVTGVTCNQASMARSAASACTVTLSQAAPAGGSIVTLSSNNLLLAVPASVTVVAGATTSSFNAILAGAVATNQSAIVTATLAGSQANTALALVARLDTTLTVTPSSLVFTAAGNRHTPQTVSMVSTVAGAKFTVQITTSTGAGWLNASPQSGSLSTQATLIVDVDPTGLTTGSYAGIISVSTDAGGFASLPVTMNVNPAGQLTAAPSVINFTYDQALAVTPPAQSISVFSNPAGASFSVAVSQGGSNWLSLDTTTNSAPASVSASVNVANLTPGTYSKKITITSTVSDPIQVPVTLTIISAPPRLSVSALNRQVAIVAGSKPQTGQIVVMNTGGGTLRFTAHAAGQGNWLSLNASAGQATIASPSALGYTLDPTGLAPGTYNGTITIQDSGSGSQSVVAVVMAVNQATQQISLSQSGMTFTAIQGGAQPPVQSFIVNSQGSAAPTWTASAQIISNPVVPASNWLSVSPAGSTNSRVTVSVDPSALPPGQYYGSVQIAVSGAINTPQSVSVLLNVLPSTQTNPAIEFSSGALIFSGVAGSTPQQQQISVFNRKSGPVNYSSTKTSAGGAGWMTLAPLSGTLSQGANLLNIGVDFSSLAAGVQTGIISLGFDDGSIGSIQIEAVTTSGAGCQSGKTGLPTTVFLQPLDRAVLHTTVAQTVRVEALDNCGNALSQTNGDAVQVTFSDNDSSLDLRDVGGGIWEGTWAPQNTAVEAIVQAIALQKASGLNSTGTGITTEIQPADSGAPAQIHGVVDAAKGAVATPGLVVPGGLVAIYGSNLLTGDPVMPATAPLPGNVNGTQLFLGDMTLPLQYVSSTQTNALIPQRLNVNTQYQLTLVRGTTKSVPVTMTLTGQQPGIYTQDLSGGGPGVVQIAGTALLAGPVSGSSRPVQRGSEYLVVYCTGLGQVRGTFGEPPPPDGQAASPGHLYQTTASVTATIGGVASPVVFAGLSPTSVALYQVNVQVPAGAPTGDAVPLVITTIDPQTGATVLSNTVTVAVQ